MKRPSWYPDELAHAGPEHLDDAYVATYDRKAGFDPTDELGRLRALGLNDAATLVDLGAGTGALALAAAPFCRRVVAVDVSSAMLAALRQKATQRKLRNVESVRSGFLTYEHTGDPADFVFSRHALHQLPDLWKAIALQRVAGFLRLGGVLRVRDLFFSCTLSEVHPVVEAWLAGAAQTPGYGLPGYSSRCSYRPASRSAMPRTAIPAFSRNTPASASGDQLQAGVASLKRATERIMARSGPVSTTILPSSTRSGNCDIGRGAGPETIWP